MDNDADQELNNISAENRLASMIHNLRSPMKFKGGKATDPRIFVEEFLEFANAAGWSKFQRKIAAKD